MNWFRQRLPRRKPGYERRQVGSIHQRFAEPAWLASGSFGTTDARNVMAVNLKTLDFSPPSEFLVDAGVLKMTNNRSPAQSLAGIKNKPEYERLEMMRLIRRHGITRFKSNPYFPVNTLTMMRGAIAARSLGVLKETVR